MAVISLDFSCVSTLAKTLAIHGAYYMVSFLVYRCVPTLRFAVNPQKFFNSSAAVAIHHVFPPLAKLFKVFR